MKTSRTISFWVLIFLIAIIVFPVLFILGVGFTDQYFAQRRMNSEPFETTSWLQAEKSEDHCARWRMLGDLEERYLVSGARKAEIYELLGPPKGATKHNKFGRFRLKGVDENASCSYWDVGACASFWPSGEAIVVCWNENDRLLKSGIWVWG